MGIKHKLLQAMVEREDARQLVGVVVADDACLGGKRTGKRGRGSENKVPFLAAVSLSDEDHPLEVRFDPIPDLTGASVLQWAKHALDPSVHLVTDGLASLAAAAPAVAHYGAIVVSPRQSSALSPFRWVNTFISNLKTSIRGTYHHFKFGKYPRHYLAEAQCRINRRFDPPSLVGRLVYTSARTAPRPENWLHQATVRAGWAMTPTT